MTNSLSSTVRNTLHRYLRPPRCTIAGAVKACHIAVPSSLSTVFLLRHTPTVSAFHYSASCLYPLSNAAPSRLINLDAGPGPQLIVDQFFRVELHSDLVAQLDKLKIYQPTEIQKIAIPMVKRNENVVILSETGSGKTYAYLLPIINRILSVHPVDVKKSRKLGPFAVIFVPNSELVKQVISDIYSLVSTSMNILPITNLLDTLPNLQAKTVLVTTPAQVTGLGEQWATHLLDTKVIVFDESDLLLSASYLDDVSEVIETFRKRNSSIYSKFQPRYKDSITMETSTQFVFVAATLADKGPKWPMAYIQRRVQDYKFAKSSGAHAAVMHAREEFVRVGKKGRKSPMVAVGDKKRKELLQLGGLPHAVSQEIETEKMKIALHTIGKVVTGGAGETKMIVFLQSGTKVEKAYQYFVDWLPSHIPASVNLQLLRYHKSLQRSIRDETLSKLLQKPSPSSASDISSSQSPSSSLTVQSSEGVPATLVFSTDSLSRGIHIPGITHVVNLDFPHNPIIYLHRAGRTARAHSPGTVISFVTPSDEPLANVIKKASLGGSIMNGVYLNVQNEKDEFRENWNGEDLKNEEEVAMVKKKTSLEDVFSRNRLFSRKYKKSMLRWMEDHGHVESRKDRLYNGKY